MKTILVPTDFSEYADYALSVAVDIAKKTKSKIILLNALDYGTHVAGMYSIGMTDGYFIDPKELQLKSDAQLIARVNKFKDTEVVIERKNTTDFLIDALLKEIDKNDIELVVMGTKGSTGLAEMFIGSNTEKIVRLSPIPVITINEKIEGFNVKEMIFANEFVDEVGEEFQNVLEFSNFFDTKIHLLRINSPNIFMSTNDCFSAMENFADKWKLKNYEIHQYDHIFFEYGLLDAVNDFNADLIVMGTKGRKGLSHLFFGSSKAEDVVNHFNTPIFTFKIK